MYNKNTTDNRATANRSKGLIIAISATLVLIILAAYTIPFIHNEPDDIIIGLTGSHTEKGSVFIAIVELDNGEQVIASMPVSLQLRTDVKVKIMERRTLFGRKSYTVTAYTDQALLLGPDSDGQLHTRLNTYVRSLAEAQISQC